MADPIILNENLVNSTQFLGGIIDKNLNMEKSHWYNYIQDGFKKYWYANLN